MSLISEVPASEPVLVVDRWNSWVRVMFPDTGETTWVDLAETAYEPLPAIDDAGPPPLDRGVRHG